MSPWYLKNYNESPDWWHGPKRLFGNNGDWLLLDSTHPKQNLNFASAPSTSRRSQQASRGVVESQRTGKSWKFVLPFPSTGETFSRILSVGIICNSIQGHFDIVPDNWSEKYFSHFFFEKSMFPKINSLSSFIYYENHGYVHCNTSRILEVAFAFLKWWMIELNGSSGFTKLMLQLRHITIYFWQSTNILI